MSFDFDEAGTAVPARTGFDFDEDGNAVSDTPKSKGLIDRIKGALSSNEAVAGGGMSAEMDTGANAPEVDPNKIVMPGSVMDGFTPKQSDEGMPIEAGMGPMRKDYYDTTRAGLMAAPVQAHAEARKAGGQVGKIAEKTLPEHIARLKSQAEGDTQAMTAQEFQDDVGQGIVSNAEGGATPKDVLEMAREAQAGQRQGKKPEGIDVFTNAVMRGIHNNSAMMAGLGAAGAKAVGADDLSLALLKETFSAQAAAGKYAAQIQDFTKIQSIGDVPTYALEGIVENAPQLIGSVGAGVLGGVIAKNLGAKALAGMVREQAQKELLKRIAVGSAVGAGAASVGMETGSIYGDIAKETGEQRPGVAAVFGLAAGALDAIPAFRAATAVLGGTVAKQVAEGVIKRYGKEALIQLGAEGGTEFVQTLLEKKAVSYVDGSPVFTEKNMIEAVDAMLKGGIAGAVMGVGSKAIGEGSQAYDRSRDLGYDVGYSPATIDAAARQSLDPANAQVDERIRPAPMPAPAMLSPEAIAAKVSAAASVDEAISTAAAVTETSATQGAEGLIGADRDYLAEIAARTRTINQGDLNGNQAAEAQPVQESQQETPADAEAGIAPPVSSDLDKQNRDRTRDASILQMQQIANKPDYELASIARDSNGAPMVEDNAAVPKENIGKAERVTLPDGTKIDTHYAVVEADTLSASHTVDGQANAGYGSDGKLTALNNGRTAGLQAAYTRGTAAPYRAALEADTAGHGVPATAIAGMKSPVLVRVYDKTTVDTANLAARSNQSSALGMSSSEQAGTDAKQITHMGDLAPTDNGDFSNSHDFISRFVKSLPITEQAGMLDKDGGLSQTGYARVRNAVLAKAYGDSPILQRMVESMDDNMRNITKALVRVAPDVAKMRASIADGSLHKSDITPHLVEAVEELSRLKDAGKTVAGELAQSGMFGDKFSPETREILTYLDANIRRPKQIGDFIKSYSEKLIAAGNPNQGSLLGESKAPAKVDLIAAARAETDKAIARAKTDLHEGVGELGDWLRQNNPGVFNLTPEEEKHIFPIILKITDAAIRLVGNQMADIWRAVKQAMATHPDKAVKSKRKEIEKHPIFQKAILQAIKDYQPTTTAPTAVASVAKAEVAAPQADMFSAPETKERSGPITIDDVPPARLNKIKVSVESLRGDQVQSENVTAKQALADVDEEISAFELLLKCLRGG